MRKLLCAALAGLFLFSNTSVYADDISTQIAELKQMMLQMQSRIEQLELENQNLKSQVNQPQASDAVISSDKSWDNAMNRFNPSISVIGDTTYRWSDTDEVGVQTDSGFTFRELELAFSANIDSYARGDVYLAVENEDGETEVALEEAFVTWLEPPVENMQAKIGRFRPAFGKANRAHLHSLSWVEYPRVIQEYLGEEGFSRDGVSASYLLPIDAFYSELTAEVMNDGVDDNNDLAYLGHWKNFFDLNEQTSLEVGGSFLNEENGDIESSRTDTSGADVTLKWTNDTAERKLTWQNELLNVRADVFGADNTDVWGGYSSLEYWWSKRWGAFGRYDVWEDLSDTGLETNAYSAGLTFAQSEYAFWRIQYTHEDPDEGLAEDNDTVWLQLNFGMGPHRAHSY